MHINQSYTHRENRSGSHTVCMDTVPLGVFKWMFYSVNDMHTLKKVFFTDNRIYSRAGDLRIVYISNPASRLSNPTSIESEKIKTAELFDLCDT